jgi:hypothetical protein
MDLSDDIRSVSVAADQLAAAGIAHTGRRGDTLRIACRLDPAGDGAPVVGYYVEAERQGRWASVSDRVADTADEAATNIVRIERLANELDPYVSDWVVYHGACPDTRADWVQETCRARAVELDLTAHAIAKAARGRVTEDDVRDYLTRRKSMDSHKLQHVLAVLGLAIAPAGPPCVH